MEWLRDQSLGAKPDTIIHLGAGICRELIFYESLNPRRIILVEPDPEQLELLQNKARAENNVQIIDCAVTGTNSDLGNEKLQVLSDPSFSSLKEPTGLLELLPGLTVLHQLDSKVKSITDLLQTLELNASASHWLIIETPGIEAHIIASLRDSGQLTLFEHLLLRAGTGVYYAGASPVGEIVSTLTAVGYQEKGFPDRSDADFPIYHLHLDPLFIQNQRYKEQIENLEKAATETSGLLKERDQKIENLEKTATETSAVLREREQQIENLSRTNQDLERNQQLLDTEVVKVEAQLEMIKDVVLRDKAF